VLIKSKIVVFDIDGTLLDSQKLLRWILEKCLGSNPDSFFSQLYFISLEENPSKSVFGVMNSLTYNLFDRIDSKRPKMFKGAKEFLEQLRKNEVKIFGSTRSSSFRMKRILEELQIFEFFELVLGKEFPKTKHIPIFAEHLGLNINEFSSNACLFGDEIGDMIFAERFGLREIVAIINTFSAQMLKKFGAKKVIRSFEELMEFKKSIKEKPVKKPIK